MALTALALNCTLKSAKDESNTEVLLGQLLEALAEHDVSGEIVRVVDHDVAPGVTSNEGPGDDWPALRRRVLDADILVLDAPPDAIASQTRLVGSNAAHLARLLQANPYPPSS